MSGINWTWDDLQEFYNKAPDGVKRQIDEQIGIDRKASIPSAQLDLMQYHPVKSGKSRDQLRKEVDELLSAYPSRFRQSHATQSFGWYGQRYLIEKILWAIFGGIFHGRR